MDAGMFSCCSGIPAVILVGFRCPEEVVMLELDRLLRPEGAAIIYDTESTLQTVTAIAKRMRWDARLEGTEGSKFLVCVKKYWTAS